MSLQVGGAVLGVAVLTVIDNFVESMKEGKVRRAHDVKDIKLPTMVRSPCLG